MDALRFLTDDGQSIRDLVSRVERRLGKWHEDRFAERLWAKDPTLWSDTPLPELMDRLGWLTLPDQMHESVRDLAAFADEVRGEGIRHVVVLGMGGSSLAPDVFWQTFGRAPSFPELLVLDTTHPDAIRAADRLIDPQRTLFVVSSKSGTTTETLSTLYFFWSRVSTGTSNPGRAFVAVTDPETPLEHLATERNFRRVFRAPSDVGGRYSALSFFGLVPAALIGVDLGRLLRSAGAMVEASSPMVTEAENPGLVLGAALGELAAEGRNKVTFIASPGVARFPTWAEQLIAESTGKDGQGILPVADEELLGPRAYGPDRVFIYLRLDGDDSVETDRQVREFAMAGHPVMEFRLQDVYDLGGEFFRWEVAVSAASALLGIHPFNQPDVQLAKDLARQAMSGDSRADGVGVDKNNDVISVSDGLSLDAAVSEWLTAVHLGDYVGIHAYLAPSSARDISLQAMRMKVRDRTQVATTVAYGPRFLHSTGQLHKGGPDTGAFLQIIDEPDADLDVPETDYSFGALIRAQAAGDAMALRQRRRRLLRVDVGRDTSGGLRRLLQAIGAAGS